MGLKHSVASFMRKHMENSRIYSALVKINQYVFHFDKREHKKKFGNKNPDKTFYVIRGCGKEAGLFALYIGALNEIYSCFQMRWIPIVDFTNDRTQYNESFPVRGNIWNAWEYYFEQPQKEYTLEEVYQSKNVILSGWGKHQRNCEKIWNSDLIIHEKEIEKVRKFISEYAKFQPEIIENIRHEKERVFGAKKEVLGVSVRGTDYVAFKPKGHHVQPPLESVIGKVKEFLSIYPNIEGIFLTTEDEQIYLKFKELFGDLIFTSNSNRIDNYFGNSYITTSLRNNNKYEQGLEYLVEKTLLSQCKYLVATRAAGADVAQVMNNNSYIDKYIFNLGKY